MHAGINKLSYFWFSQWFVASVQWQAPTSSNVNSFCVVHHLLNSNIMIVIQQYNIYCNNSISAIDLHLGFIDDFRLKSPTVNHMVLEYLYYFIISFQNAWNTFHKIPDSKVYRANMGPTWGLQDPCGPHVGPMNLAIWNAVLYNKHFDIVLDMITMPRWYDMLTYFLWQHFLVLFSYLLFHNMDPPIMRCYHVTGFHCCWKISEIRTAPLGVIQSILSWISMAWLCHAASVILTIQHIQFQYSILKNLFYTVIFWIVFYQCPKYVLCIFHAFCSRFPLLLSLEN